MLLTYSVFIRPVETARGKGAVEALQTETNNEKLGNSKKSNYLKFLRSLSIFVTLLT